MRMTSIGSVATLRSLTPSEHGRLRPVISTCGLLKSHNLKQAGLIARVVSAKSTLPVGRHCRPVSPTVRGRLGGRVSEVLGLEQQPLTFGINSSI